MSSTTIHTTSKRLSNKTPNLRLNQSNLVKKIPEIPFNPKSCSQLKHAFYFNNSNPRLLWIKIDWIHQKRDPKTRTFTQKQKNSFKKQLNAIKKSIQFIQNHGFIDNFHFKTPPEIQLQTPAKWEQFTCNNQL